MDRRGIKSVLITGANAGIGREVARQMALRSGVERVYLACRNEVKARAAKQELERRTGKFLFEIILMDVSDVAGVRSAIVDQSGIFPDLAKSTFQQHADEAIHRSL